MKEFFLPDETATLSFGRQLAKQCPAHCIIFLTGDLGAGKTTLVRGFLQGLGYTGNVKSPTYTLVEPYEIAGEHIFHFDLYRLHDPTELDNIGFSDYLTQPAILLIEWPERGEGQLPVADLDIHLETAPKQTGRKLLIKNSNCDINFNLSY